MSEFRSGPVMRLEAENLLGADGEYAVDFVAPGWLDACRRAGGTFLLYPQTFVDALAAQRDEGLAREAELRNLIDSQGVNHRTNLEVITAETSKEIRALDQRLAEAEKLLRDVVGLDPRGEFMGWELDGRIDAFLARPDCSDALKAAFEAPVLCGGCHHYTSSPDHFDEAGKCKARPGCTDGEKAE